MRYLTTNDLTGTKSWRLASRQCHGFGGNTQNGGKEALKLFEAGRGNVLVQCDQEGAEAKHVAWSARPGAYREVFKSKVKKPHTYYASQFFGEPLGVPAHYKGMSALALGNDPEWPKYGKIIKNAPIWYDLAKRINHACNYLMGPMTFCENVHEATGGLIRLTMEEARQYIAQYFALFPEIRELQREIKTTVRRTRRLTNGLGYETYFPEVLTDAYLRFCVSWIFQSTVGCITHAAVVDMAECKKPTWRLRNNKHDSAMYEVPEEDGMECARLLSKCMSRMVQGRDEVYQMTCEVSLGKNWGKHDPETNPCGMQPISFSA